MIYFLKLGALYEARERYKAKRDAYGEGFENTMAGELYEEINNDILEMCDNIITGQIPEENIG